MNSEYTFYGKTDCKDFDLEKKIYGNKKENLEGLTEQNEVRKISENISGQKDFSEPDDLCTLFARRIIIGNKLRTVTG